MVKKTVFKKTGLFDCQFERMRMGDGEFGARCIKNGMLLISNPKAIIKKYTKKISLYLLSQQRYKTIKKNLYN